MPVAPYGTTGAAANKANQFVAITIPVLPVNSDFHARNAPQH